MVAGHLVGTISPVPWSTAIASRSDDWRNNQAMNKALAVVSNLASKMSASKDLTHHYVEYGGLMFNIVANYWSLIITNQNGSTNTSFITSDIQWPSLLLVISVIWVISVDHLGSPLLSANHHDCVITCHGAGVHHPNMTDKKLDAACPDRAVRKGEPHGLRELQGTENVMGKICANNGLMIMVNDGEWYIMMDNDVWCLLLIITVTDDG